MNASEVLIAAADLIERDGWCRGIFQNALGQRCVLGAVGDVCQSVGWDADYKQALEKLQVQIHTSAPSVWNDSPKRTESEVVNALREAARL